MQHDKTSSQVLIARQLVLPEEIIHDAALVIENGKIVGVGKREEIKIPESASLLDVSDKIIAPGFIDQLIHGCNGYQAGKSVDETLQFAKAVIRNGVTSFLPTVSFYPTLEEMLEALQITTQAISLESPGAEMLGINFEAPFFTKAGKSKWDRYPPTGFYAGKMVRDPSVEELHLMAQAADGNIKLMTIAPELEGALDVIREMCNLGIVPSIGHTAANYDQVKAAIEAGAKSTTHLYNAMRRQDHRDPGAIDAVLTSDELMAEIIADCIHVFPPSLGIAVRCKGTDRLILVSDTLKYAGMPNGTYKDDQGREIVKDDRKVYIPGWTLAGSITPLNRDVHNMIHFVGQTLPDAIKMASLNPAKLLGAADRKGSLEVGKDADLIVIDEEINVFAAMCKGKWMFGREDTFPVWL